MRLAYKWQAAIVVAIGLFMAVLDNTIVSVALPQMAHAFNTSYDTITWVVTAYFLAQAAVIPLAGFLSDRLGSKVVFLGALALFTAGSLACALAPSKELLITFRVIQGIGGGVLFPVAFAIIFRVFPPQERGPASAIIGVPVLLAPAFGPTIGGFLTTDFTWNAIFTINVPIGIVALLLCWLVLRGRRAEQEANGITAAQRYGFDGLGLLLSMAGVTALVYGISEAGQKSWSNATVDWSIALGVVLLVAFIFVELRTAEPVMDVRLFKNYTFTIANIVTWSLSAFLFGSLILLPAFFENVQGRTALTTGELLISQGVASAVGTVIAGRFYNRFGPRVLIAAGMLAITLGTFGITQLAVSTTGASLQGWLILRGLGLGLANTPLQTLALAVVSNRLMARASSLVTVTRQIFGALGVSALTTYLTQQATAYGNTAKTQIAQAQQTRTAPGGMVGNCLATAHGNLQALQACIGQHVQVHALNDTFWIVLIGCAATFVLALFVGRDPAVEQARAAAARGEKAEARPAMLGE